VKTDVAIVGAGPTGLALAGMLEKAGVRVRVFDKIVSRSDKSRALGVQAGTLEAIEDVFGKGVAQDMVAAGRPARKAFIHLEDHAPVEVDMSSIPSVYNYILILSQSETEKILEGQLQTKVEYGHELTQLSQNQNGCEVHVKDTSGHIEVIDAKYVVGCDGAHSVVRQQIAVPFAGAQYEGNFVLGDVKATWPWEYGTIRTFVSAKGALAAFPMKGEQRYRFILIPKEIPGDEKADLSQSEFQNIVDSLVPAPVAISDATWLTRFRVHHRIAEKFRNGRVFLAGDAAHIHSPAGGQGMNTGIQDSFYLGAQLIQVLKNGADEKILDFYEKTRLPVAKNVLRGTDFVFRLGILPENRWIVAIRKYVLPLLLQRSFLQKRVARVISQVDISRAEHPARTQAFKGDRDADTQSRSSNLSL